MPSAPESWFFEFFNILRVGGAEEYAALP